MHPYDVERKPIQNSNEPDFFEKRRRHCALSCLLDCLINCCFYACIESKRKKWHLNKSQTSQPPDLQVSVGWPEEKSPRNGKVHNNVLKTLNESSDSKRKHSQVSSRQSPVFKLDGSTSDVLSPGNNCDFQSTLFHKPSRSLSTSSPIFALTKSSKSFTKKSANDVAAGEVESTSRSVSRLTMLSDFARELRGSFSKPTSPTSLNASMTPNGCLHRSPSNYCRVATCEKCHLHERTPKCLETFAPSSTCSSCQHCDRQHIGPNHDQVLLVERLLKSVSPMPRSSADCTAVPSDTVAQRPCDLLSPTPAGAEESAHSYRPKLLMQWPPPEYRPQKSPDHLYRSF
ncbi:hypothetical protein TYRP_005577, partial [Tyrophagus putrescentiae]